MAKKKQKKQHHPVNKATTLANSRTQQEYCYSVAKKILRHFGLEPELIDVFTKKQKQFLLTVMVEPPIVKPKLERTVPRQYVKNIHTEMYRFMKTNFWGDPENQLTYMDVAIYGISFLVNIASFYEAGLYGPGILQEEAAKRIYEKTDGNDVLNHIYNDILRIVWYETKMYSRINFRTYCFEYSVDYHTRINGKSMRVTALLTAWDSESKKFTYRNIERKAFGVLKVTDDGRPVPVTVRRNKVFPTAKESEMLNVYVQSHVLHRFKERLDAFGVGIQNLLIHYAFTNGLQTANIGRQVLFTCLVEDDMPVGYFAFFIQDNDIVINTFIPLASANTPEGSKLHELLPLGKDDIIYLGMDKLSFYLTVDFEQIPVLKQALIDSNIWPTKLTLDRMYKNQKHETKESLIDMNKTMFVKNFFDKLEEHSYPVDSDE